MHDSSPYYAGAAVNLYALGAVQACKRYHAMLATVYGPDLVMPPYIMSVDALEEQGTSGQAPCSVIICTPQKQVTSLLCGLSSHLAYHLAIAKKNGKHAH